MWHEFIRSEVLVDVNNIEKFSIVFLHYVTMFEKKNSKYNLNHIYLYGICTKIIQFNQNNYKKWESIPILYGKPNFHYIWFL